MKQVIFLSTLILLSGCGDSERDSSSASSAPALTEVFPVSTPNSGSTPRYVYSSKNMEQLFMQDPALQLLPLPLRDGIVSPLTP